MNTLKYFDAAQLLNNLKNSPSEKYESETIEFKGYKDKNAFFNKAQEVAEELTAFANKNGGAIIVGIIDSSNIKHDNWQAQLEGIEEIDALEVRARIAGNLRPALELRVQNYKHEDKNYLIIEIDNYQDTLVSTSKAKYYIRDGRSSRPMEPLEVERAVKSLSKYDWSQDIVNVLDIYECIDSDLLESAVEEYHNLRELTVRLSPNFFLESVGATINGKLTKAGLLFLGTDDAIQSLIGNIEYRVSKKDSGGSLPINEVWKGALWKAVIKTKKLFQKIVTYEKFSQNGKSYTFPLMDLAAFEEAFINALVHRDYAAEGMVTIDFMEERVIVSNPGCFYGGINNSNIFTHQPRHRNKALSQIFMNFNLMDRAGMGTRRMTINSLKYGRSIPTFKEEHNSIRVILESNSINEELFEIVSQYHNLDIAELVILTEIIQKKVVAVRSVLREIESISISSASDLKKALRKLVFLELYGDKNDVYVRKKEKVNFALGIYRKHFLKNDSNVLVNLFLYLLDNQAANKEQLCLVLNIDEVYFNKICNDNKFIVKYEEGAGIMFKLVDGI